MAGNPTPRMVETAAGMMNAIGLHNVDVIMAVTFLLTVFAAVVSSILLAVDRRLHRGG